MTGQEADPSDFGYVCRRSTGCNGGPPKPDEGREPTAAKGPERPTLRVLYRYQRAWRWNRRKAARWAWNEWRTW